MFDGGKELSRTAHYEHQPGAVDGRTADTHSGSPPFKKKALVAKSITFTYQPNPCQSTTDQLFYSYHISPLTSNASPFS